MFDNALYTDTQPIFNISQAIHLKDMNSFAYIFMDNYNYLTSLFNSGKLRSVTFDNIQKTILCGSFFLGCDFFECPVCGEETIIPHSCHSRFCTKCGVKETKQRSAYVSSMALDAPHRHIVFTIPDELRHFFISDCSRLNILFISARNTLACVFNNEKFKKMKNKNKKKPYLKKKKLKKIYDYKNDTDKVVFGAMMTLHTFGRDLKWNPHIHVLVCEEAYDSKKNKIKSFAYIDYKKLRKTWMFKVLEMIEDELGPSFKRIRNQLYSKLDKGFYVYAKKREDQNDDNVEECVKYITRYTSRPPMAESRIIEYDNINKMIRWCYNRHEDDEYMEVYEHAHSFLNKLILHCPDKNFRMTRYYGFYSTKNRSLLEKVYGLYGRKLKRKLKNLSQRKKDIKNKLNKLKFRTHMIESFGKDPILCKCGHIMEYTYTYDPFEGGTPNDRTYRQRCIRETRRMSRGVGNVHWD